MTFAHSFRILQLQNMEKLILGIDGTKFLSKEQYQSSSSIFNSNPKTFLYNWFYSKLTKTANCVCTCFCTTQSISPFFVLLQLPIYDLYFHSFFIFHYSSLPSHYLHEQTGKILKLKIFLPNPVFLWVFQ